jgi:nicotinate-nucleotide pyrophosphorylase (carboxylating)
MYPARTELPRRDGPPGPLPEKEVSEVVRRALEEDLGGALDASRDVTTAACVGDSQRASASLVAREDGLLAGLEVFVTAFRLLDKGATLEVHKPDGEAFVKGEVLAVVSCERPALLAAERTALNFIQRLSGVATRTAQFVSLAGGAARVLDTRKTTPGMRLLERYAVRCGGGENHRFSLADEVMIKDNHADLSGLPLEEVVRQVREKTSDDVRVTVEARGLEEAQAAVRGGADVVLLDNLAPSEMSAMLEELRSLCGDREVEFEASGGVTLETMAGIAACGVDRVSVGGLTHSAPAVDLALEVTR